MPRGRRDFSRMEARVRTGRSGTRIGGMFFPTTLAITVAISWVVIASLPARTITFPTASSEVAARIRASVKSSIYMR